MMVEKQLWSLTQTFSALIPYSRKLSRKKIFANLIVCGYSQKFIHKICGCSKSEQSANVFSTKIVFFFQFVKVFSLECFLLSGIPWWRGLTQLTCWWLWSEVMSESAIMVELHVTTVNKCFKHVWHNVDFAIIQHQKLASFPGPTQLSVACST